MKKKRGRKKGQTKRWCVLPHCSRCKERLHNDNGIKAPSLNGGFTSYCKKCNTEVAIIKAWRKRGYGEIFSQIWKYYHLIGLLYEAVERKEGKK